MHLFRVFLRSTSTFWWDEEMRVQRRDDASTLEIANDYIASLHREGLPRELYSSLSYCFAEWDNERAAVARRIRAQKGGKAKALRARGETTTISKKVG
jgi:hypothetical protein